MSLPLIDLSKRCQDLTADGLPFTRQTEHNKHVPFALALLQMLHDFHPF